MVAIIQQGTDVWVGLASLEEDDLYFDNEQGLHITFKTFTTQMAFGHDLDVPIISHYGGYWKMMKIS
jgi:hypothetical protein